MSEAELFINPRRWMAYEPISSQTDGSFQTSEQNERLQELCRILTSDQPCDDLAKCHKDALLVSKGSLSAEAVAGALKTLMDADEQIHGRERDTVIGNLSWHISGQICLARMLMQDPTNTFVSLWKLTRADAQDSHGVDGLVRTCLSPTVWPDRASRTQALPNLLRLLLAKLVGPDGGRYGIAMKAIARIMVAEAEELESIFDESNFTIILDQLSIEGTESLRSRATLATAKFVQAANGRAQAMLEDYIKRKIAKQNNDDFVKGFSAAAAMFPILPDQASKLFLTPGFLEDLINVVRRSSTTLIKRAALELLSAACVGKDCRAAINSTCSAWLSEVLKERSMESVPGAALVLSKISQEHSRPLNELIVVCKRIIMIQPSNTAVWTAIEAMAYNTTRAEVKQDLVGDIYVLERIMNKLKDSVITASSLYGGLVIMANLTNYTLELSAEQKRMAQLKAYANQSKPAEPSPLEKPERVGARGAALIEINVVPMLVKAAKGASSTSLGLIAQISSNLAKERKNVGKMLQQGVMEVVLPIAHYQGEDLTLIRARKAAAQAVARLCIPVDPTLIFEGSDSHGPKARSVPITIRALAGVLEDRDAEDPRIPFEALQALTNLASMSEGVGGLITKQAFSSIESYLSSNLPAQQQAAAECLANLSLCKACSDMFITEDPPRFPSTFTGESDPDHLKESRFLRIAAMIDDDVRGVRLSAMTTLYNICESKLGVRMLTAWPSGLDRIVPHLEATNPLDGNKPDTDMRARVAGVICHVLQHSEAEDVVSLMKFGVKHKLGACKENDSTGMVAGYANEALGLLDR